MSRSSSLETAPYPTQLDAWPRSGRHILAQYDADSIVVYQAYGPAIGHHAARHGEFGGSFSYGRMSWVKPNFLWMMYRSGWGTKSGQEVTLAVRLPRDFFDELLEAAVPSTFDPAHFESREHWQAVLRTSQARLQWDPDHDPAGGKVERRAIQIGIRGALLERYGRSAPVSVSDVSALVDRERPNATPERYDALCTPRERVYLPASEATARKLGLSGHVRGS